MVETIEWNPRHNNEASLIFSICTVTCLDTNYRKKFGTVSDGLEYPYFIIFKFDVKALKLFKPVSSGKLWKHILIVVSIEKGLIAVQKEQNRDK